MAFDRMALRTISLLVCGSLALALAGCGAISSIVDTSKKLTAKLTGADDPNNTSALAQAGRMQNAGTDAVAGVAGVKTDPATSESQPVTGTIVKPPPTLAEPAATTNPSPPNAPSEPMSVSEMQRILIGLGYQPGPPDGTSGKRTTDALRKFQQANKLPASGILDSETISRLRGAKKSS